MKTLAVTVEITFDTRCILLALALACSPRRSFFWFFLRLSFRQSSASPMHQVCFTICTEGNICT